MTRAVDLALRIQSHLDKIKKLKKEIRSYEDRQFVIKILKRLQI